MQVARHLFHNCLRQYLVQKQGACVVLVTHQLQVEIVSLSSCQCHSFHTCQYHSSSLTPKFVADADRVLVLGDHGQQIAFGAPGHPEGMRMPCMHISQSCEPRMYPPVKAALLTMGLTVNDSEEHDDDGALDPDAKADPGIDASSSRKPKPKRGESKAVALIKNEVSWHSYHCLRGHALLAATVKITQM